MRTAIRKPVVTAQAGGYGPQKPRPGYIRCWSRAAEALNVPRPLKENPMPKLIKQIALPCCLVATWVLLCAMGGQSGPSSLTNPKVNYNATLEDIDGRNYKVSAFNLAGETALSGKLGRGTLRVDFAQVAVLEFADDDDAYLTVTLASNEGDKVDLEIRDSTSFYGTTAAGLLQLRARDLKRVTIER